jgi:hypothetical protein
MRDTGQGDDEQSHAPEHLQCPRGVEKVGIVPSRMLDHAGTQTDVGEHRQPHHHAGDDRHQGKGLFEKDGRQRDVGPQPEHLPQSETADDPKNPGSGPAVDRVSGCGCCGVFFHGGHVAAVRCGLRALACSRFVNAQAMPSTTM